MEVITNDAAITYRVVATTKRGTVYSRGARVVPQVAGRSYRSLSDAMLATFESDPELATRLRVAIRAVNAERGIGVTS